MSNSAVGGVYEIVINDVIEAVGVDFEEAGVDASVLQELKTGWQQNLTKSGVAAFPWDPKPAAPESNAAPSAPPAVSQPPPQASYTQATPSAPPPQNVGTQPPAGKTVPQLANGQVAIKTEPLKNEPVIKQEPGRPVFNPPPQAQGSANDLARQRAMQHISSRLGQRGEAVTSSFHNGQQGPPPNFPQQQQQQQQQQGQAVQPSQSGQPQKQLTAQQYGQSMAAAAAAAMQHAHHPPSTTGQNGLPHSQVDGSSEAFQGVLMQRDANGYSVEMGRVEIDNLIHSQIAARAKQMEGGGLMLPLRQATKHRSLSGKGQRCQKCVQVDGPDPDLMKEEEDADAINSDLDDPDEDQDEDEEDDESMGHMMLCMYDKVQRVKNKWKCTLKDGVLTVSGREYVFHKATGEFEW